MLGQLDIKESGVLVSKTCTCMHCKQTPHLMRGGGMGHQEQQLNFNTDHREFKVYVLIDGS